MGQQDGYRVSWGTQEVPAVLVSLPDNQMDPGLAQSALRRPCGAAGSVRQFWCTIHVAAETWSRGTTNALGASGRLGSRTKTNHSCCEAAVTP